jgi:putative spermidine/putrescine transport system permease protein
VLATVIYDEYMQLLNWPGGSALAFALTVTALVVVWISGRLAKRWGGLA